MQLLIAELKQEHDALKKQVALIKQLGVITPAGFEELQRLKKMLLAHIGHEDRDMYPRLERAAKRDSDLQLLLTRFRNEMNEITVAADKFFRSYTKPTQTLDFARDVASVFSLLTNRIITEESVLFPHLAKLP